MTVFRLHRWLLSILFIASSLAYSQQYDSLIIGEFEVEKITDGDTFRFRGLDRSVRLLGIDTEETFKDKNAEEKTNLLKSSWKENYQAQRSRSNRPVKIESPFGYKTWQWTKEIFNDVTKVRLIKENNSRFIDTYGRYLVYVICIKKDGTEFNYNVEVVRQGYSPYYTKYGYSRIFHEAFTKAQEYAKANKLGIWNGDEYSYPDYDERVQWWNRRGDALIKFENKYKGKKNYFGIYEEDEFNKLYEHIGENVIVFNSISDILTNKDPYLIRMLISKDKVFDGVIHQENYSIIPWVETLDGEYVYMKGKLVSYNGKLEIELKDKEQVWTE